MRFVIFDTLLWSPSATSSNQLMRSFFSSSQQAGICGRKRYITNRFTGPVLSVLCFMLKSFFNQGFEVSLAAFDIAIYICEKIGDSPEKRVGGPTGMQWMECLRS